LTPTSEWVGYACDLYIIYKIDPNDKMLAGSNMPRTPPHPAREVRALLEVCARYFSMGIFESPPHS